MRKETDTNILQIELPDVRLKRREDIVHMVNRESNTAGYSNSEVTLPSAIGDPNGTRDHLPCCSALDNPRGEVISCTPLIEESIDGERLLFSRNNRPRDIIFLRHDLEEQETVYFIRNNSVTINRSHTTGIIGYFRQVV